MNKPKEPRKTSKLEEKIRLAGRYTLASFLPGKVQKNIAKKHREDELAYLAGTILSEMTTGAALFIAGITVCPPLGMVGACIGADAVFNFLRGYSYSEKVSCGHLITTMPYHIVKQPYNLGKYVKNKISSKGEKK